MHQDRLAQLRAIDADLLTEIVRQDQRTPAFELTDWTVEPLSSKGISNPEGLFRVRGTGQVGQTTTPWSVVLKIVTRPDHEQDLRDLWYWKRELRVAQSQLLTRLAAPVVAPRCYGAVEHADDVWLWMEQIVGRTSQPWTLSEYAFAARELGRFNGAYLTGTPLPDEPWLCHDHVRGWLAALVPEHPARAWENRFVRGAFAPALRPRVERLWAEQERFLAVLSQLPQVCSHFDYQRRNLFIRARPDGRDEVVAVDWQYVGIGALGGDLFHLTSGSAVLFEWEPAAVGALEAVTTEGYLAGLHDVGWQGDADLVRLGYTTWLALMHGACLPTATTVWMADDTGARVWQQFGRSREAVAAGWATLCAFALDRADEARQLMDRLHVG